MNPTLKNVLYLILAYVIGSIVNMGVIILGTAAIPPPEGVIAGDMESMNLNFDKHSIVHFLVPLIAHALGTLVGAYAISRMASSHFKTYSYIIGGLFFLGGLYMAFVLPEWWKYSVIDLILAYFPMAYLGWRLAKSPK